MTRSWEDILQSRRRAGDTTPKNKALAWHTKCLRCEQERPRHEFRRWQGAKRMLFKVCNHCHPEKTIKEMSADELRLWFKSQQVPAYIREKALAARDARISRTRSVNATVGSRTYWRGVRRETWRTATLLIRAERTRWQALLASTDSGLPRYSFAVRYISILADLLFSIERVIKTGIDRQEWGIHNNKPINTRMTLPGVEKEGQLCFIEVDDPADWPVLISETALRELNQLWLACANTGKERKGRPLLAPEFLRALAS